MEKKHKKELTEKQKEVLKRNSFKKGDTSNKAANGKAGGIASGISKRAQKEFIAFQIAASEVLNNENFQADSLNALAKKARGILENPLSLTAEVKLAMEILQFFRDSSGQKPSEKNEISGALDVQKIFITRKC